MSSNEGKDEGYWKEGEDWSISDGDYQGSEGNNSRSDIDWNGGSSMAGEASGVSEATEEEQPEEEEEEEEKKKKSKQKNIKGKETKPKKKFNVDDVGTDDDSRPLEDSMEKSDTFFKSNVSQITDISDVEDQIFEAHSKFAEDKQSLSSVIDLVDEVTIKGENLARKASETSIALDKEKLNKGPLMENKLKLLEHGGISDILYDSDVLQLYGSNRKGRKSSVEKDTSGKIEYMTFDEEDSDNNREPEQDLNLHRGIEFDYVDDDKSLMSKRPESTGSGSANFIADKGLGSFMELQRGGGDHIDVGIAMEKAALDVCGDADAGSTSCREGYRSSEDESRSRNRSQIMRSDDEDTVLSPEQSIRKIGGSASGLSQTSEGCLKEECLSDSMALDSMAVESMALDEGNDRSVDSLRDDWSDRSSRGSPVFVEPECCKNDRHKHMCCFINIGGGGDSGGRENEIINRLKKLRDDIASMREELGHARKECKKESEEVAKLIEETIARNKAAEQQEYVINQTSILATPPTTPPTPAFTSYILEEMPQQATYQQPLVKRAYKHPAVTGAFQQPVMARAQVPVPTAVLEDRLRATRQTASTSYRASLDQLERMVEKEMASIQDSMTRLEPLNKMSAEWDHLQHVRSRSMTFMRDYRMEMVTAEMRLQGEKNLQNKSIEIN